MFSITFSSFQLATLQFSPENYLTLQRLEMYAHIVILRNLPFIAYNKTNEYFSSNQLILSLKKPFKSISKTLEVKVNNIMSSKFLKPMNHNHYFP